MELGHINGIMDDHLTITPEIMNLSNLATRFAVEFSLVSSVELEYTCKLFAHGSLHSP
jgi:hypothetical protein